MLILLSAVFSTLCSMFRSRAALELEQPGDRGDTASMPATLAEAGFSVAELAGQAAQADAVGPVEAVSEVGVERVVADKGLPQQAGVAGSGRTGRGGCAHADRRAGAEAEKWSGQSAA